MPHSAKQAAQHARRRRLLGPNPVCVVCGWTDPAALERRGNEVLCYECARRREGRATSERHHVIGRQRAPDLVVRLPGNLHRALDARKGEWDTTLRRTHAHDALLRSIAVLHAMRDWCEVMLPELAAIIDQREQERTTRSGGAP